jgi:hypothetical protein
VLVLWINDLLPDELWAPLGAICSKTRLCTISQQLPVGRPGVAASRSLAKQTLYL